MIREVGEVRRGIQATYELYKVIGAAQAAVNHEGGRFCGRVLCVVESRRRVDRGPGRSFLEPVFRIVPRVGSPFSFQQGRGSLTIAAGDGGRMSSRGSGEGIVGSGGELEVLAAIVYPDVGKGEERRRRRLRNRRRRRARGW